MAVKNYDTIESKRKMPKLRDDPQRPFENLIKMLPFGKSESIRRPSKECIIPRVEEKRKEYFPPMETLTETSNDKNFEYISQVDLIDGSTIDNLFNNCV